MSTEINIRKRIDIQEEGVSITPDVNSINFIGAGVTASTVGDNVTVNVQGSIGATAYYLNETVTQAPYKEFSSIPTAAAEQTIATVIGVGATATIQSFQTPSGVPNTTNIPAGLWQFYLHFSGTAGDSWDVYAEVYKRDLGGIETLLLTTDVIPTTVLSAIPTMILTDGVFPASTVLTTDRIVVKVLATNTGVAGQTITFHTEGSTNYSVGTTTLNQVLPTGAVSAVTGTAPVVSSGGTTPAISMPQANGSTDGYLSSADWTTFNNKRGSGVFGIANTSGVYTFYTTLTLAMAAATAGQTIEMFADVTESSVTSITLKNGVNINGNGHTYNYTAATGNCFIDNGVAVVCNIQNLNVVRTGHTADNILRITATNSFIDCIGSFLRCTSASSNAFVVYCSGSISNVNVLATGTNLQGIAINSFGAKGIVRNSYSETTGAGTAIGGDIPQYAAEHGIFNCYGKSVSGVGLACVKVVNSIGWSTSGSGIGGGNVYSSTGVSISSYGIIAATIYSSTGISTSGIAIGGAAYSSSGISASGSARGNGGSYNCNFTTAGAPVYPTFGINPGSIYNCFLESTWNNSAGHGLTFASNYGAAAIDVVNSTIRVVNASANCIVSFNGAGTPINYSNNVFKGATTPIGPNITQNVVNTQDNQGNILL
jgi:hypothetical protein